MTPEQNAYNGQMQREANARKRAMGIPHGNRKYETTQDIR